MVGGVASATVSWSSVAGATSYTATAVEDPTKSCTWTTGPLQCAVTGLTNGIPYTFTLTAESTSTRADPSMSTASSPVTPREVPVPTPPVTPTPPVAPSPSVAPTPTPDSEDGAPILRALLTPSRRSLPAGQEVTLALDIRNVGTASALKVGACVAIPAGFELVNSHGGVYRDGEVCDIVGTLKAPTARRSGARNSARNYNITLRAVAIKSTRFAVTLTAANAPTRRTVLKSSHIRITPGRSEAVTG